MKASTIRDYMTAYPHTVGKQQSLRFAHEVMRVGQIRHLPVLDGGKLVGLVSERDMHIVETFGDVDPETTTVQEAMTQDVYVTAPDAPLEEVASSMAEHKYGSAVVMSGGKVVGMFTTVDALRALATIARHPAAV
jgi:acetoin utilization protein AcuB